MIDSLAINECKSTRPVGDMAEFDRSRSRSTSRKCKSIENRFEKQED